METSDIGAILRFYFAQTDEVTGRESTVLADELLNDLKRFAAGGLPREELESISAKIASNTPAIERLAREIKLRWDRSRFSS
ncbi:MAG: hypothetical protein JO170_00800 [Verrucomicrobia bacterium]|nr:hypothetical protein [Verrucomicrobiota bacterium]